MVKYFKTVYLLFFFIGLSNSCFAQPDDLQKVLFVGNSYTYFWNLPQAVACMAEYKKVDLETRQSTAGGANLGQHWRSEKKLNTVNLIIEGDFDSIILQDHSTRAIEDPDSLIHFGKLLGKLIKSKNAQPYLYMTWAREWDPYMQDSITAKYFELAQKINARIVPVGLAWQRARQLRPDLKLYNADGSHPSTLGAYLSACVFFGVLTNESPIGLPERLISKDKDGEKLYLNIQSKEDALFCQKVALEIISQLPN